LPSKTPSSVGLQYTAFLSYSHAADGRLAEVTQSSLQRFATPWYRRRSIRVFRDTTGLGPTPDLWDAIRVALEASEYFILFASEQAARSQWVGQEVDAFLSVRSADRLLIVWTDGELCWDDAAGDFDWTRTTCLPARLRRVFHAEPLYLDLRWASTAKDLSPRRPEFLDAVARLSATLRQLPIDDLVGEDVKQYRRTRQVAAAAVAALTILLIGAVAGAVVAIQQRNLARQQRRVAEEQREESRQRLVQLMVANGVRRLDEKDLSGSALWFAEALRLEAGATGHDLQRLRLRTTLGQHPRLLQMWATGRPENLDTLKRWVTFGRGNRYAITNAVEGDLVLSGGRPSFELRPAVEPRLWETRTGTRVQLKPPGDGLRLLAIDADADRVVIATAGADGAVRTWNGTSGAALARMTHPCAVKDAQFSGDGRVLITDCDDQVIRLWDSDRGTLLASLQHPKPVSFAWIAANRQRVLSGTTDNTAHVWSLGPQNRVVSHVEVPHTDDLQEVDVGLDGRRVLTLANYTARLWEVASDHRPVLLKSSINVNHIELSPDGRIAVLATGYGRALAWRLETGDEIFTVGHDDVVFEAAFSPDGSRFATASGDRSVRVWDAHTGNLLTAPLYHEEPVGHLDFSSERMWLATITRNEIVRVWDLETGPKYPHEFVNRVAFHPDGKHVMTVSDFEVKVWDIASWTSVSLSPQHQIYHASISPDGHRLATASEDGLVRIWNPTTGSELQSLRHGRRVRQAVFSRDGRKLASAGQVADRQEVAIWDLATGSKSLILPHGTSYLTQIEFSPDGSRLLTIGSEGARLWDVGQGYEILGMRLPGVDRATFDPSGKLVAMQQSTEVVVLDAETGRRLFPPFRPDNSRVTGLAFASGGRSLLVATESGIARIWDSGTGEPTTPPFGHGRASLVRHVVVSADGRFVATVGDDGSARIWDVVTAQPLTPPLSHSGGAVHAAFSPDGLRLVTVGNGTVRQWDLSRDASGGSDAELSLRAQLLAARQIDPTGAVSALSLDEIRAWASKTTR
jgi:WD40 repeat protein